MRTLRVVPLAVAAASALLSLACSSVGTGTDGIEDLGGNAGTGAAGKGGAGGSSSGHAGAGLPGGASGTTGGKASSGAGGAGTGGAGASGAAGTGGATAGASGEAGASGGPGGVSGTSGQGGESGAGGGAGTLAGASGQAGGGPGGAGGTSAGGSGAGPGGSAGAGGSTGTAGTGSSGAGGVDTNCSEGTQLVYVFSSDNAIWSFDPPSKKFAKVASPDCAASSSPNSMAIDRNLVAWINYIGSIYTFDLNAKKGCKLSKVALPSGFEQVGMGFSTDTAGGSTETLFVDGIGGGGLAKVNGAGIGLTLIGAFSKDKKLNGQNAELTGTGDGRLFGYFTTSPSVRVAEIDKATASVISDFELTGVSPPSSWAFTFWGGDFYLYAAPGKNSTGHSSVVHYDPVKKTVDPSYVADVGFTIVGAGVSTCAPIGKP